MSPKEFRQMPHQEYAALGREAAMISDPKLRRVLPELVSRLADVTQQARSDPQLKQEVQGLTAEARKKGLQRECGQGSGEDEHD